MNFSLFSLFSGGHDVWLETTEAYARQLEMNEDYTQAATYYLACHKIHKAIKVLQDNKLYRYVISMIVAIEYVFKGTGHY